MRRIQILLLLSCLLSLAATAQDYRVDLDYYLPDNVQYDPAIPTPKSVIGHEVGDWHITHDKLVYYMQAIAAASDRVTIENRGTTFEGRPLLLLTITSPENHSNIAEIRKDHLQLVEKSGQNLNIADMPLVVYQGFSIHGNEPSGSNAALALAYHLAAGQGPAIDELLSNTVILLDPSLNPDGLQRFAYWANIHKSEQINPDPNDREYTEVWPRGRTNHYWFDMNRDWLPVQLPESRARIKSFHQWYPNILTDHHEMGTNASFFFQPGIPSRTHPLTPQKNQDLTGAIAKFHARALDKIGSLYYSEESFDDFYYGKGSTFPDINGGIGILFEQASSRGHAQESVNGVLTFPFTIRNHFTAALSTLEAGVSMRKELLDYQRQFFKDARKEASGGGAIVFGDEKDAAKAYHLAEMLKRHQITVHELAKDFSLNGKNYKKGYGYIVPKNQRQHRLIKAIFEKRTTFQDSLFYDVSAWTIPLAFNLDYSENVSLSNAGPEVKDLQLREPATVKKSEYAYLMEWHEYYAPKALNQILQAGLRAKVSMRQFSLEGKQYDYGTIMIPVANQKMSSAAIATMMAQLSKDNHIDITGVGTGLTKGIDLGSNLFRPVKKPSVAVIVGDGLNSYDAGEIWHLFDQRYAMRITKLDQNRINRADLNRYTAIIVPNGSLGKSQMEKLKEFAREGGTLIGFKNAARAFSSNQLISAEFKSVSNTAKDISFEQKRNYSGAKVIGGAIFETKLDRSHPVAFGYKNDKLPIFRNSTIFMKADAQSYNNPVQYTSSPLLSGYIAKPNLEALASTVPFKVARLGSGKVAVFTDNTNFRAFWYGTNKLMMNAVFFGDSM
ncbi:MAG: M14 family metallopeptidase [Bacteroidota bacterium]